MQIRVVTLRYNEALQGFPEDALKSATFGREVLNATEHFFVHGNVPHLTLVLSLGDTSKYENADSYRQRDPNAPDPETGMTDEQKMRYRALKTWRNETAKSEGRPAYAIARNVQLAELVKAAPKSLAAIKEINGLGEGFCERYGKTVLGMMEDTKETDGFRLVSTMSEQTGFHFDTPVSPVWGNEHAPSRSASSAGDRRTGTFSRRDRKHEQ